MNDEVLDAGLATGLINDYIHTEDVIVYANAQKCAHVVMNDAYKLICEFMENSPQSAVQVVASDFSNRVLVEPIGVGVGEIRKMVS
jgi:hypothetical protein